MTRTLTLIGFLLLVFGTAVPVRAAHLFETFVGIVAERPAGVIAALDDFFATNDATGYSVSLFEAVYDGQDPATHYLVAEYDSYAGYEALRDQRESSAAWSRMFVAFLAAAKPVNDGMGILRADFGPDAAEPNYVAVFNIDVADATSYVESLGELADSDTGRAMPGKLQLLETRAAGDTPSHYVVMSAPSFAALNEYLDALFASEAYGEFADDVADIRSVVGQAIYKRARSWSR